MRFVLACILCNYDLKLVIPNGEWFDQKVLIIWSKGEALEYVFDTCQRFTVGQPRLLVEAMPTMP